LVGKRLRTNLGERLRACLEARSGLGSFTPPLLGHVWAGLPANGTPLGKKCHCDCGKTVNRF
jgi:hypothetical protein